MNTNVFIVGAGASREFGLPTGAELLSKIEKAANFGFANYGADFFGDYAIYEACMHFASQKPEFDGAANKYINSAKLIKENMSLAPSIDNFLHTHSEDDTTVELGKLLIAYAILNSEYSSNIYIEPKDLHLVKKFRNRYSEISNPYESWMADLFRILVSGTNIDQFEKRIRSTTFISFNYDRCIENFLYHTTMSYFGIPHSTALNLVESTNIIHPYGSLGQFEPSQFGEIKNPRYLIEASKGIRTFTEGVASDSLNSKIHSALKNCVNCIFLGFGYHELNLELLFRNGDYTVERVIGSAKGIDKENRQFISDSIKQKLLFAFRNDDLEIGNIPRLALSDSTCSELIRKHERFLTKIAFQVN